MLNHPKPCFPSWLLFPEFTGSDHIFCLQVPVTFQFYHRNIFKAQILGGLSKSFNRQILHSRSILSVDSDSKHNGMMSTFKHVINLLISVVLMRFTRRQSNVQRNKVNNVRLLSCLQFKT